MFRDHHESGGGAPRLDFDLLVERYYEPLYRFALSLTQSEADAWDLTQQTFYTWALKGAQLRDPAKVKTWMFTTLHRAFLQSRRRQTRFPHCELSEVDAELPCVAAPRSEHLDGDQVRAALTRVDQTYQAPVALFYFEDQPYAAIAHTLKVPLGTVKSRIARGLGQLRQALLESPRSTPAGALPA